jgi:hypothetical protein
MEGLAVAGDSAEPVLRQLVMTCHGVDENTVLLLCVEQRARKARHETPPRTTGSRLAMQGERSRALRSSLNFCSKARAKPLADILVVLRLGKKLGPRLL